MGDLLWLKNVENVPFFSFVGNSEEVKSFIAWIETISTEAKDYLAAVFLQKNADELQIYIKIPH